MLGVIFLCLKVIGIILLVILGIVLALLLAALFVPVRYSGEAKWLDEKKAQASVTWGGIVFRAVAGYGMEKGLFYAVRVFGILLLASDDRMTIMDRWKRFRESKEEKKRRKYLEEYEKQTEEFQGADWDNDAWSHAASEDTSVVEEKLPELPKPEPETEEKPEIVKDLEERAEGHYVLEQKVEVPDEMEFKDIEEKEPVFHKVKGFVQEKKEERKQKKEEKRQEKEKQKEEKNSLEEPEEKWYNNIEERLEELEDKYERLERFYYENQSQYAVQKLFGLLIKTIRYILPVKTKGFVRYGLPDPAMTGKIYGVICALGLNLQSGFRVEPEFQDVVIEADLKLRGRLRVFYFVRLAATVYFDKKLMRVYKKAKKVIGGVL